MQIEYKKTSNGRMFKCMKCNDIHIEFKMISLNLSLAKFKRFSTSIIAINGDEWEAKNASFSNDRKILIPLSSDNTFLIQLNKAELEELKELVEQIKVSQEI